MSFGFITFLVIFAILILCFSVFLKKMALISLFGCFEVDSVSINLSLISVVFILSYSMLCFKILGKLELFCLGISLLSSLICFFSSNVLVFWMSYEMTIMPLLVCLYVNSPYSERFLAGWYLLFYILVTSVPLLVLFCYNSLNKKSFNVLFLDNSGIVKGILFLFFMTKMPLPPFHSWLPVVHAEASTFVSVVLSGYVMKLGMVGIFRFCSKFSASLVWFLVFFFFISLFFFFSACGELDSKRWLAFLSLVHILVSIVGFCYLKSNGCGVVTFFCLGHGLSAGLLFYLFKVCYDLVGSRSWVLIGADKALSKVWRAYLVLSLLTVASFPPSISFLTEVVVLSAAIKKSGVLVLFGLYLFFGGLVPILLISYLLVNYNVSGVYSLVSQSAHSVIFCLFFFWLLGAFIM